MFGKEYSSSYDLLYREKDYDAECDTIEQIIRENRTGPAVTFLDLGCGTGSHAIRLAKRGYQVTGVDRSREMLDLAKEKSREAGVNCRFIQSDIRSFRTEEKFDVIIMMFAVLGYFTENDEIRNVLDVVSDHLNPGGLFIGDVWFGPAVLHEKPDDRMRVLEDGKSTIIRSSSGELDHLRQVVTVRFRLWNIKDGCLVSDISEEHKMRFFFPRELEAFLDNAGLSPVMIRDFSDVRKVPDEISWNIWVIARK